jgi:hypothetical protein
MVSKKQRALDIADVRNAFLAGYSAGRVAKRVKEPSENEDQIAWNEYLPQHLATLKKREVEKEAAKAKAAGKAAMAGK